MAYQEKIPVVPISLYGTDTALGPFQLPTPLAKIGLMTGEIMRPEDFGSEDHFIEKTWEKVRSQYEELRILVEN